MSASKSARCWRSVAVLIGLSYWRTRPGFLRHAFVTNTLLMVGGFLLVGYQLTGYVVTQ